MSDNAQVYKDHVIRALCAFLYVTLRIIYAEKFFRYRK